MSEEVSTSIAVISFGVLGMIWPIYILKRDLKKKGAFANNVVVIVALLAALLICVSGVAKIFH